MKRKEHFESWMDNPIFNVGINVILMLSIFGAAEIGRLLGIKGIILPVSVVWPATGFALASVLLFGYGSWPGIFFGNLLYNALQLYGASFGSNIILPLIPSIIISIGSLAQALLGGYIMRRYSSQNYFLTVKDVFIFLIPSSLLACMIAPTIGVIALYIYGTLSPAIFLYVWTTFWLGDTLGVYVFTPLLVVWSLQQPIFHLVKYYLEITLMLLAFTLLVVLTFFLNYPLYHLFLPLSLWAAYRFGFSGGTMSIFIISFSAVVLTSLGYGLYNPNIYPYYLGFLVSFLEVIVAATLILAAVINEREEAWNLIQMQNQDLQQTVEMREEALKEMQSALFIKKKLIDSLGLLTSGITKQLKDPLKRINDFVKASNVCLNHLQQLTSTKQGRPDSESIELMHDNLKTLDGYLRNIVKFEAYSDRVVRAVLEQSELIAPYNIEVKSVNLNTLLNECLVRIAAQEEQQHPNFHFITNTKFSESISNVLAMPESLSYAFTRLLDHAIKSLRIKKGRLRASFVPQLEVSTIDYPESIEIIIKDNAAEIPPHRHLFGSFVDQTVETSPKGVLPPVFEIPEDSSNLDLALTHDILVHVHHGKITVNYQEGEYVEIVVTFPKHYMEMK